MMMHTTLAQLRTLKLDGHRCRGATRPHSNLSSDSVQQYIHLASATSSLKAANIDHVVRGSHGPSRFGDVNVSKPSPNFARAKDWISCVPSNV
jgi:hypothetical protein